MRFTRSHSISASRVAIVAIVSGSLALYFTEWRGWAGWLVEVIARTYLHFIAGVMAHEASHGHLGNSKRANLWWGRLANLPTTVPNVTFRSTHLLHHANTNIPGKDPDEFLNTPRGWEVPLRALAMPHHWLVWLRRNGRFGRPEWIEYFLTYAAYIAVYGAVAALVGWQRVLGSLLPAAVLHSMLLWYCFAIKTHEGYSLGAPETRSHNYYGRALFWLTFGLSMHRTHHLRPRLSWLEAYAEVAPGTWRDRLTFRRDVIRAPLS